MVPCPRRQDTITQALALLPPSDPNSGMESMARRLKKQSLQVQAALCEVRVLCCACCAPAQQASGSAHKFVLIQLRTATTQTSNRLSTLEFAQGEWQQMLTLISGEDSRPVLPACPARVTCWTLSPAYSVCPLITFTSPEHRHHNGRSTWLAAAAGTATLHEPWTSRGWAGPAASPCCPSALTQLAVRHPRLCRCAPKPD